MDGIIDIGLWGSYLLVAICAGLALIMPLIQALGNPKSLAKSIIGVLVVGIIFGIGYIMADSNAAGATATTSKTVGAGLITMYIFVLIAMLSIVYSEVSKFFN